MDDRSKKTLKCLILVYCLVMICGFIICAVHDELEINSLDPQYHSYTDFIAETEKGTIFAVYPTPSGERVYWQYKEDITEDALRDPDDEEVIRAIEDVDPSYVSIKTLNRDTWHYTNYKEYDSFKESMLMLNIPILEGRFVYLMDSFVVIFDASFSLLFTGLMIYFLYCLLASQMKMGDSKYEISKNTGYKFSDVIGHDEIIEDVKTYIKLLRNTKELTKQHIKPPKGILFTGDPGTGKTLLAKAMAGEAEVPFIYLNTSNVIEMYVGVGARTIRSCFRKARQLAPCVVFLDEIDAIGGGRTRNQHGTSEDTQTLLALLQELDGFSETEGILVIAATNCPETLDKALTRSGRFDREIVINPPRNRDVRLKLLKHYTQHFDIDPDTNLEDFAAQLTGMTGADIANICNEAAILASLRSRQIAAPEIYNADNKPIDTDELSEMLAKGSLITPDELKKNGGVLRGTNGEKYHIEVDEDNNTLEIKKSVLGVKITTGSLKLDELAETRGIVVDNPVSDNEDTDAAMHDADTQTLKIKGIVMAQPDATGAKPKIFGTLKIEKPVLRMSDFTEAMDKLLLKGNHIHDNNLINAKDREVVAYHESGHAVMSYLLGESLSRITIQGTTSGVGGFVMSEDKDSQFRTREDLLSRVRVAYAGRASEKIKFGAVNATTGASNDIEQATKCITNALLAYGFDDELGMLDYNALIKANIVDNSTVWEKIKELSIKMQQETDDMLSANYYLVETLAQTLLDCETMTGTEAIALLDSAKRNHRVEDIATVITNMGMPSVEVKASRHTIDFDDDSDFIPEVGLPDIMPTVFENPIAEVSGMGIVDDNIPAESSGVNRTVDASFAESSGAISDLGVSSATSDSGSGIV